MRKTLFLLFTIILFALKSNAQGNCLNFDGVDDKVSRAYHGGVYSGQSVTLEAWVLWNPTTAEDVGFIMSRDNEELEIHTGGAGTPNRIRFIPRTGTYIDANNALPVGKWSHIACQINTLLGEAKIYVNGVEQYITITGSLFNQINALGTSGFTVGARYDNSYFFKGSMDEVKVFREIRTQAQIQVDMVTPGDNSNTNMVLYYDFNDGVASGNNAGVTTAQDKSYYFFNGAVNNFALTGSTSNWVESYAMVIPTIIAVNRTQTAMNPTWTAPVTGTVENYLLDVSTNANFSSFVSGYNNLNVGNVLSYLVTGLDVNTTYYVRVRANKVSVTLQGAHSITATAPPMTALTAPGNALHFNGAQSISLGSTTFLGNFFFKSFTIETWIKTSSTSGIIFSKRNNCVNNSRVVISLSGNNVSFEICGDDLVTTSVTSSGAIINDNTWHHVAFIRSGIGIYIYVDGILNNSNFSSYTASIYNAGQATIGYSPSCGGYFTGALDEFRIYETALTEANIQHDMRNPSASVGNLISFYNFDNGIASGNNAGATVLIDYSGLGNHGTLNNFALNGNTSNWVESYAMVLPTNISVSNITNNSFTLNWTNTIVGTVENYLIDISRDRFFGSFITGYNGKAVGNVSSENVTGLDGGSYFVRIRANKTSVSGQSYNKTMAVAQTTGYTTPGNALSFTSPSIVTINNNAIGNYSNYTFEGWIRTAQNSGTLFSKRATCSSGNNFDLSINTAGELNVVYSFNNVSGVINLNSSIVLNDNVWHHVAVTSNGTTMALYIDGLLNTQTTIANTQINNTGCFSIGNSAVCTNSAFNGSIDEVRIYNTNLTQAQILADMYSINHALPGNLQAYYDFNNGMAGGNNTNAITLVDQNNPTITGNHANLANFSLSGNNSNWIESYAMVNAIATAATNITTTSFSANWNAPAVGIVDYYNMDVAFDAAFTNMVPGLNNLNVGNVTTFSVLGLNPNYYYYRVRPQKTTVLNQAKLSNTISLINYFSPGEPNNALHFNGAQSVNAGFDLGNFGTGNFTFQTWVKTAHSSGVLFSKRVICDASSFISVSISNGNILFELMQSAVNYKALISTVAINDNAWHHVAVVRNGTSMQIYIDGVLRGSATTAIVYNISNTVLASLGHSIPCGGYFTGALDELRMYNIALNQTQIQTEMLNTTSSLATNLLVHYNFNEGIPSANNAPITTINDISGNATNGSLIGFGLIGDTSNFIESYAKVLPTSTASTNASGSSFRANWTAPNLSTATQYYLDVSTNNAFSSFVSGYNNLLVNGTSQFVTGLTPSTNYYYRVRAYKNAIGGQGINSNTITATTGNPAPNNAINFDGVDDFLQVPHHAAYNTTKYTIQGWVLWNPTNNTDIQFICSKGFELMEIHTGSSPNNLRFIPTTGVYLDVANALPTGRWAHIACVYDPANSVAKIYINGVDMPYTISGAAINTPIANNATNLNIGRRNLNPTFNFKGSIDEFRIFNDVRTAAEIQADMVNELQSLPSSLIAYFRMDAGIAEGNNTAIPTIEDASTNNNPATFKNFSLNGTISNLVESYAMVAPTLSAASNVGPTSFTVNWTAPSFGTVNNYLLDVSTNSNFSSFIGSYNNYNVGNVTNFTITGLTFNQTYYYRVRANKTSLANQGAFMNNVNLTGNSLVSSFVWLGTINSNWNTTTNWQGGVVPSNSDNVIISNAAANNPILISDLNVASLVIEGNKKLEINGNTLNVTGIISGTGTIVGSPISKINLTHTTGTSILKMDRTTDGTSNVLQDLTINGTGGITQIGDVTGAGNAQLYINRKLEIASGTLDLTNSVTSNHLVMMSNANGTARLAQLGGNITQNAIETKVAVDRFIRSASINGKRAWRLLSSPLSPGISSATVKNTWQNDYGISGYGTNIYGPTGTANGFEDTRPNHSMLKWINGTSTNLWENVTNTNTENLVGNAFFLFIRGDKTVTSTSGFGSTTLRSIGRFKTGTQTFNATMNLPTTKYIVLGNPFASPINPDEIIAFNNANTTNSVYLWDPNISSFGGYVTLTRNSATTGDWTISNNANQSSINIQSGAAFFIEAKQNDFRLDIPESAKSSTNHTNVFGSGNGLRDELRVLINKVDVSSLKTNVDGFVAQFSNKFSNNLVNGEDAIKFHNPNENVSLRRNNNNLCVEGRSYIGNHDTLFVNMANMVSGSNY
ncbi:MAG: LamG-like jellyroll fold domain-containing protein, partial [Chitinophagaceae bacterium]